MENIILTKEILDSLTVPVLKDVVAIKCKDKKTSRKNTKEALISELERNLSPDELARVANRFETIQPRKHCWVFDIKSLDSNAHISNQTQSLLQKADQLLKNEISDPNNKGTLGLYLRDVYHDEIRNRVYLKFVHLIKSYNWEQTSPTIKEIKEKEIRHPVVVILQPSRGSITLQFDGYKQGLATPADLKVPYGSIVHNLRMFLSNEFSFEVITKDLFGSVSKLTDKPEEVEEIRRLIRPSEGGFLELDTGEGSIANSTQELVRKILKLNQDLESDIKNALSDAPTDAVVLLWKKLDVITRITFLELGTEILFIWRQANKSEEIVDYVITQLSSKSSRNSAITDSVFNLLKSSPSRVQRVTELSQNLSLSPESTLNEAEALVKRGLVRRSYRVRSKTLLQGFINDWKSSIGSLPEVVEDEDGELIDTRDPKNIEYGYSINNNKG